jgi:hypothetical protein
LAIRIGRGVTAPRIAMPLALRGVLARGRRSNSVCPLRTAKDRVGRMGYRPLWTAVPYLPGGEQHRCPFFPGRWRWVRCPPGSFPRGELAGGSPKEEARGFERSPGHYLFRSAVTRNRRTLAECACPIDPSITRGRNHSRRARYTPIAMHIFLDINQLLVSRQTWAIPPETSGTLPPAAAI